MISIGKSWKWAISKPITMIVFGTIFSLIFIIPFVGAMLAPFLTTVLASVYFIENKVEKFC